MWLHNTTSANEPVTGETDSCPYLFCDIRLAICLLLLEVLAAVAYVIISCIFYKKDKPTDPDGTAVPAQSTRLGNIPQASGSKVTVSTDLDHPYCTKPEQPSTDNTGVKEETRRFNFQVPVDILTALYAAAIGGGGIFEYMKTGSAPSLIVGVACGTPMMVAAYQMKRNTKYFHLALVTSAVVAGVMAYKFALSGKFLPSGLVGILSVPMVVRFGYKALAK